MAKVKRFRGGGSSVAAAAPEDKEPSRQLKSKPRQITRTLETADSGGKYPVKPSSVKADTAGGNNIIKRPASEVMSKASRAVEGELSGSLPRAASAGGASGNVYEGTASRIAKYVPKVGAASRILSGAGMALYPSELGDSSLSKSASEQAVKKGAFKQDYSDKDSYTPTSARDRAADLMGQPKAKPAAPDVEIKAVESKAPAVSKPALKSGTSKPKGPTEGDRARAALKEFRDWNASRAPLDSDSTKAEDMNTQGKIEAVEGMKKGGMTKRPPKPAKKVPARKFASGGSTSRTSASKRGDGCATKGHTKGKYL
jgi:hypothetical protein